MYDQAALFFILRRPRYRCNSSHQLNCVAAKKRTNDEYHIHRLMDEGTCITFLVDGYGGWLFGSGIKIIKKQQYKCICRKLLMLFHPELSN